MRRQTREGILECLVCFDEIRDLFPTQHNDATDVSGYGALRRAFRHRATRRDRTAKLEFFRLVTDTTSLVLC